MIDEGDFMNAENKNVSWSTSDENIATVDQNGNVKAINDGVATIKVTTQDQSKTAICTVNVLSNRVTGITLNKIKRIDFLFSVYFYNDKHIKFYINCFIIFKFNITIALDLCNLFVVLF